jgi:hypothetical protein
MDMKRPSMCLFMFLRVMNYEGNKRTRTSKVNKNGERGGDFAQL